MRAAPRPANISTNDAALASRKFAPDALATAFASSVFPVPGGPWRRIPRGTGPEALEALRSRRNSTTSSSSAFASSSPATSAHETSTCEPRTTGAALARGMNLSV